VQLRLVVHSQLIAQAQSGAYVKLIAEGQRVAIEAMKTVASQPPGKMAVNRALSALAAKSHPIKFIRLLCQVVPWLCEQSVSAKCPVHSKRREPNNFEPCEIGGRMPAVREKVDAKTYRWAVLFACLQTGGLPLRITVSAP